MEPDMSLSPEDAKLVTLARASRARTQASDGAAVRDLDGRTYTAARVKLPSLQIEALELAVAMAVSSGATGLEAGAIVTDVDAQPIIDLSALREFAGRQVPVVVADPDGTPHAVRTT
jgi:hypothetical protein